LKIPQSEISEGQFGRRHASLKQPKFVLGQKSSEEWPKLARILQDLLNFHTSHQYLQVSGNQFAQFRPIFASTSRCPPQNCTKTQASKLVKLLSGRQLKRRGSHSRL